MKDEAKRRPPLLLHLASIITLIVLVNGCTMLQLSPYESPLVSQYKNVQIKDELAIAVQPMTDKQELEKYFGTDLSASNVLVAYMVGENRHPSSSFILLKDRISLNIGGLESRQLPDKAKSTAGATTLLRVASYLGSPVLAVAATNQLSDASVINHAFRAHEFQTTTLAPGQTARGFLYFQLPKEIPLPKQWSLQLEARDTTSKTVKQFNFPFELEGQQK